MGDPSRNRTPWRIRRALSSDVEALTVLADATFREAFGDSLAPEDLVAHLALRLSVQQVAAFVSNDEVLIAQSGERLVGFAQFGSFDETGLRPGPAGTVELRRLYVERAYQRRGIGSALIRAVFAHPTVASGVDVTLDVWSRNVDAQRLYRRHGFEMCGERRFEVASGVATDPDYIMVRRATR